MPTSRLPKENSPLSFSWAKIVHGAMDTTSPPNCGLDNAQHWPSIGMEWKDIVYLSYRECRISKMLFAHLITHGRDPHNQRSPQPVRKQTSQGIKIFSIVCYQDLGASTSLYAGTLLYRALLHRFDFVRLPEH